MTDQDWTPREKRLMAWMLRVVIRDRTKDHVEQRFYAEMADFLDREANSMERNSSEASPREKLGAVDGALYVRRGVGYGTHFSPTTYTEADVRRLARAMTWFKAHRSLASPWDLEDETALKPFLPLLDGEKK